MVKQFAKFRISIDSKCFIFLPLAILIVPLPWITAWLIASVFHEFCHCILLAVCGCRVYNLKIELGGAVMETDEPDNRKELICALAGPIGGALLILSGRWFPRLAVCSLVQSVYNLLPIYPMDGGRAMRCVLRRLFSDHIRMIIERIILYTVSILFLVLGLYALLCLKLGPLPLIIVMFSFLRRCPLKCTCKEGGFGVK